MDELFHSLSGLNSFAHFCAVFNGILQLTGRASDVISSMAVRPIVLDKCVKFRDPSLNRSREIPPEAAGGSNSTVFFAVTSDLKLIMTSYPVWL